MRAMVLERPGAGLALRELPIPQPGPGQVLLRVRACGVCRTDLHILDGELDAPVLPLVPGHQIAGEIEAMAEDVRGLVLGQRVGVPWLGSTCRQCALCMKGRENLCPDARFTGYQLPGGFAEYAVADARYAFALPDGYDDLQAAPLLCAGLIGYRALRMCGDADRIGLYGFGSAAHIVMQVLRHQGRHGYAFTRSGDTAAQDLARALGAVWIGSSEERPPTPLDAAIVFAPVGALVPKALEALGPGGSVVCAGIHMTDIPSFPYRSLWLERSIRSVANLTRADGEELLALAPRAGVRTQVSVFDLEQANEALQALRLGRFTGSAVLRCST
ncbi:MAG: zinc-dependent alcohol dehydrogenase family protein [Polyangiales bacterium]